MISRERVIKVIQHGKPDRMPIYGWVRGNLDKQICASFGSVEAFEDRYEFDLTHIFGGPSPYCSDELQSLRDRCGGTVEPSALLEVELSNPNEQSAYDVIRQQLEHHKIQRGRFAYVQTPGIFECLNEPFGIQDHLMYLALYESELAEVYRRQAEWNRQFTMNCLDLGVDMIHVSDDWGAQNGLMFNPDVWRRLIFPYHKTTCDAVRKRGGYLSLHSDGNISQVLDGIVELGYQVVHPFQESAGMDLQDFRERYMDSFVVMGGLDVQTTIGFGNTDKLKSEIERVIRMFADGGLIFCTSHFVQDHCTIEELTLAYDWVYELVRKLGNAKKVNESN
jgi:uroporphyrinogen decarboxylase